MKWLYAFAALFVVVNAEDFCMSDVTSGCSGISGRLLHCVKFHFECKWNETRRNISSHKSVVMFIRLSLRFFSCFCCCFSFLFAHWRTKKTRIFWHEQRIRLLLLLSFEICFRFTFFFYFCWHNRMISHSFYAKNSNSNSNSFQMIYPIVMQIFRALDRMYNMFKPMQMNNFLNHTITFCCRPTSELM